VHSELLKRVTSHDEAERMPPEGARFTESQVEALQQWIAAGAPFPSDEVIPKKPSEHWAFQPVKRPECRSRRMRTRLMRLSSVSTPHRLMPRRMRCYDVCFSISSACHRLSKSRRVSRQTTAFVRVIDDLLTRPEYGERWARHWLDVVRYADTNGYERDAEKPFVWRYRDYVIEALNKDKPFDRFVIEQIAGDELPDKSLETHIATGFLRLGHWDDEPADPPRIATTSSTTS
jgi:hypothetical protein